MCVVPRQRYCESLNKTVRRKTRTVMVGNVALGSDHPIRIQTMTTTDTKDVAATVEQVFFCSSFLEWKLLFHMFSVVLLKIFRINCWFIPPWGFETMPEVWNIWIVLTNADTESINISIWCTWKLCGHLSNVTYLRSSTNWRKEDFLHTILLLTLVLLSEVFCQM